MTQPPRRRPPTEEERWNVIARRAGGGSDSGGTRFYRRVPEVSMGGSSTPPTPIGRAILVAEMSMAVPDTGEGIWTPVVDYGGEGNYFQQTFSGAVWNSEAGPETGYLAVRMREITPGYQITYIQFLVFNDANYLYLESQNTQSTNAVSPGQLYLGDPDQWSAGWVGTDIIAYPEQPGYAVEVGGIGVFQFRVTLGIEAA